MNIVLSVEHPAWAHQFHYIINELKQRGDNVTVIVADKDGDTVLLEKFGIPYIKLANSTGRNTIEKAWLFFKLCITYTWQCKKANVDILIGRASPMMSIAAFLLHRPHVMYEDSEVCVFGLTLAQLFSTRIITPRCFYKNLGKKQIKVPMYKELYYLSPEHFQPDSGVLQEVGIEPQERYVVVRFVAWKASHDFGMKGLGDSEKIRFVQELSKYAKVYITSEDELCDELKPYQIKVSFEKIHHVLYYATLVFSDGATMASEAVVLGTHAIRLCPINCGTFTEQEERYQLLKWIHGATPKDFEKGLAYAKKLLDNPNLWDEGKKKREYLLSEMVDCNKFFIRVMDDVMVRRRKGRRI